MEWDIVEMIKKKWKVKFHALELLEDKISLKQIKIGPDDVILKSIIRTKVIF